MNLLTEKEKIEKDVSLKEDHEITIDNKKIIRQIPREELDSTLNWLCTRFPDCFNMQKRFPLEIGVTQKLIALAIGEEGAPNEKQINQALRYYTRNPYYQLAMVSHTHRINLDGNPVQEISEKDKEYAKQFHTKLKEKHRTKDKKLEAKNVITNNT